MDLQNELVYPGLNRPFLSREYLMSYGHSPGITKEHQLDASVVFATMLMLPGFRDKLMPYPHLETLDIGSGEGIKSELILRGLMGEMKKDRGILHAFDPDPTQIQLLRTRLANEPAGIEAKASVATLEDFLDSFLDAPNCSPFINYATCFHILYYLKQIGSDDGIFLPTLGKLVKKLSVPLFLITEDWGQLQGLKWHMRHAYGYGIPASVRMVLNTLRIAKVGYYAPIAIPNHWPVDMTEHPGLMFKRDFAFLLDGNWDSPELSLDHCLAAGEWIQSHARFGKDEGYYLDGPDKLIITRPPGW
jgi:hypothetical protein